MSADRPWLFLLLTLICAGAATVGTVSMIRADPGGALVGRPGRHDRTGNASADCLDCHVPFVGTPASRCLSPGCHGNLATGTPPRSGSAMPERFHVALRDVPCSRCHLEHRRVPPREEFDHQVIPDEARRDCRRCHHAADRPSHAKSDAVSCGGCHGWTAWTAQIDHRRVDNEACELCHRRPDSRSHAAVAGTCDDCHRTEAWAVSLRPQDPTK